MSCLFEVILLCEVISKRESQKILRDSHAQNPSQSEKPAARIQLKPGPLASPLPERVRGGEELRD